MKNYFLIVIILFIFMQMTKSLASIEKVKLTREFIEEQALKSSNSIKAINAEIDAIKNKNLNFNKVAFRT